jgi:hypothetical protein
MHLYKVGELYIPGRTSWPEAGEFNYRGGEHELRLFWPNPSPEEVGAVAKGPAQFALFVDGTQIIFLYRFGTQPWSDAPYTWHRVAPAERVEPALLSADERVLLSVILVDAATGLIHVLRAVSLSHEFSRRLHDEIRQQAAAPYNASIYDRHLAQIYGRNSSDDLVRRSVVRCYGGD